MAPMVELSGMDKRLIGRAFVDAVKAFYADPKNVNAYQESKKQRRQNDVGNQSNSRSPGAC